MTEPNKPAPKRGRPPMPYEFRKTCMVNFALHPNLARELFEKVAKGKRSAFIRACIRKGLRGQADVAQ